MLNFTTDHKTTLRVQRIRFQLFSCIKALKSERSLCCLPVDVVQLWPWQQLSTIIWTQIKQMFRQVQIHDTLNMYTLAPVHSQLMWAIFPGKCSDVQNTTDSQFISKRRLADGLLLQLSSRMWNVSGASKPWPWSGIHGNCSTMICPLDVTLIQHLNGAFCRPR